MLKVENLRKSFSGFKAVNGANLDVKKGEIVAVIGPNGAGKTTLFNLITGILKPDAGTVLFKGEDITGMPPHQVCKKGLSRSFQVVNVFSRLTVFENVRVSVLARENKTWNMFTPAKRLVTAETERIIESVGLGRPEGPCKHGPLPWREKGAGDCHSPRRQPRVPDPRRAYRGHVAGRDRPVHRSHTEALERLRSHHTLLRA